MRQAVVDLDIDCISGPEVFVGRCATVAGLGHGSEVVQCGWFSVETWQNG